MTTLRTVEEVTGKTHLKWLEKSQTANLPKYGELTVLPYGFLSQAVNEVLTQDRLAISTALVEALEEWKYKEPKSRRALNKNEALTDAQNIIKQLLESKN